jgi:hypothetical protein
MPSSPFRPGLPLLNHERFKGRLAQVGVRAAHVAVVLAEAQQFGVSHFAKPHAQRFNVNVI